MSDPGFLLDCPTCGRDSLTPVTDGDTHWYLSPFHGSVFLPPNGMVTVAESDVIAGQLEPDPHIRLVTIFETEDAGVIAIVKAALDEAGIDHVVRGEIQRNVTGWSGFGAAEFQVREQDERRAAALVSRLTNHPN